MLLGAWLRAFLLTVAIELPIVLFLSRDVREPPWRRAAMAIVAQLATHPLVWFVFPFLPGITGWQSFVSSEIYAWLLEAFVYALAWRVSPLRAVGISGLANGLSMAIGLAI